MKGFVRISKNLGECVVEYKKKLYYGTILEIGTGVHKGFKLISLDNVPEGLFHPRMWFLNEDILEN